ncbi:hypothetical protein GIB67_001555 [Kingdonia uniflora]|uniref:Uncharacterized protein n=1 Tax=Kingdonia uniflora TaxID=39325 RepID=A0A7J7L6Q6_9MAGN|nr:hypothetical protein GIB67_001555 [Kingdonia uniflora]
MALFHSIQHRTPNVYFENENAINLDTEIARSKKIKCSLCGIKGAALGCYEKNCQKSFHVSCARLISRCRWDVKNFVMLCPLHPYSELPKEKCGSQGGSSTRSTTKGLEAMETEVSTQQVVAANQQWKWSGSDKKWVLCCSMHTAEEKEIVSAFLKLAGVLVLKNYGPSATHVLVSTDENGACTRNLKFLMGILEGKWILSIDWVKGCMKAMEPVAEEKYEISVDIYGTSLRPRLERLQVGKKGTQTLGMYYARLRSSWEELSHYDSFIEWQSSAPSENVPIPPTAVEIYAKIVEKTGVSVSCRLNPDFKYARVHLLDKTSFPTLEEAHAYCLFDQSRRSLMPPISGIP